MFGSIFYYDYAMKDENNCFRRECLKKGNKKLPLTLNMTKHFTMKYIEDIYLKSCSPGKVRSIVRALQGIYLVISLM